MIGLIVCYSPVIIIKPCGFRNSAFYILNSIFKKAPCSRRVLFVLSFLYNRHQKSVGNVGKKSNLARSLDCYGQLSLVKGTGAGYAARKDFSALRDELSEFSNILVIDLGYFILAENANFLSSVHIGTEGSGFSLFHFKFHNLSDSRYFIFSIDTVSLGVYRDDGASSFYDNTIRKEGFRHQEYPQRTRWASSGRKVCCKTRECIPAGVLQVRPAGRHHLKRKNRM